MKKSDFMFTNPKLITLDFQLNKNYENKNEQNMSSKISISTSNCKINEKEAVAELDIEVGEVSDLCPFYVHLIIGAKFKASNDVTEVDFEKLLEVNASALLLSYARPIIALVTSQSGYPSFNLPFMNFTKE